VFCRILNIIDLRFLSKLTCGTSILKEKKIQTLRRYKNNIGDIYNHAAHHLLFINYPSSLHQLLEIASPLANFCRASIVDLQKIAILSAAI